MPPIRYDYRRVGGRYEGDLGTPGSGNWATGEMAAARPKEVLPRAVITPQGYSVLREDDDEGEDMRRVLLNWPENVVILHNWHY